MNWFIRLLTKYYRYVDIYAYDKEIVARRYFLLWRDRFNDDGEVVTRWAWQKRLTNIVIHNWRSSEKHDLHSHPNWTVTIVLKGWIIEERANATYLLKSKILRPGSIVFRNPHDFHRFIIPPSVQKSGGAWTLFIRAPWKYRQYFVDPKTKLITNYHDYLKGRAIKWTPYELQMKVSR